jgi:transcriptional regulator with XRE-family HTH domain
MSDETAKEKRIETKITFGLNLRYYRNKAKISQKELAKLINSTDVTVSRWETGKSLPDPITLQLIAEVLNTTIEKLMEQE